MNTQSFYKIIDPSTGLFSSGGICPTFSKVGKTWSCAGAIRRHLNLIASAPNGYHFKITKIPEAWVVREVIADFSAGTASLREVPARDFYLESPLAAKNHR